MTVAEIEKRVLRLVRDSSYEGGVLEFINDGIEFIAGNKNLGTLETSGTVTCSTDSDNVDLPDDYMRNVYHVSDGDNLIGTPQHYHDFARFLRYHQDLTSEGSVFDVCVKGNSLYYASREDIDLTVRYFKKPTELTKRSDTPSCIPSQLHRLLVYYCAWQIFDEIEDGIDDPKTNMHAYESKFFGMLPEIDQYCIDIASPEYIQDEADRIFW
jgi:hypothetical protein